MTTLRQFAFMVTGKITSEDAECDQADETDIQEVIAEALKPYTAPYGRCADNLVITNIKTGEFGVY